MRLRAPSLAACRHGSYLVLSAVLAAACVRPGPVRPSGSFQAATRAELEEVARRASSPSREILRFQWRSDDGRVNLSGSGATRIAPPDSMRVDLGVRLGVGRATVILTGDEVQAEPEDVVRQILTDRFALWAAAGILRLPDADVVERLNDGPRTFWRTVDESGRATIFELRGDTLVSVLREEAGRLVAHLQLTRASDGRVRRVRAADYARGARFEVTITAREPSGPFPDEIWRLRP